MAFWRNWIGGAFGSPAQPRASFQPADGGVVISTPEQLEAVLRGGNMTAAGVAVTPSKALTVGAAYACIRLISSAPATLPLDMKRRVSETVRAAATDSPAYRLLKTKPNRWQTPSQFKRMMQANTLLRGAGTALKVMSRGQLLELIPLHPDRVTTEQTDDLELVHTYTRKDGRKVTLRQEDVFQLVGLTLDGVHGVTPLTYAREVMGEALAQGSHGATIFKNGGRFAGMLTHPNKVGPEAVDKLRADLAAYRAGGEREGQNLVLEEGMKFEQVSLSSVDAQWIESRAFTRVEICMFFGVPPQMIGINDGVVNAAKSLEQQSSGYVAYTLEDHLTMWEEAIKRDLIGEDEPDVYARFNRAALVKGDLTARWAAYVKGLQWGVFSPNEIRALEDENPREGGDIYYPPPNMTQSSGATDKENGDDPS